MTSSTDDERNPNFSPLKLPWNWHPDMIDDNYIPAEIITTRKVNIADLETIYIDSAITQSFISNDVFSASDPESQLSLEDKCKKYLGFDDDEIELIKALIIKDKKDGDD